MNVKQGDLAIAIHAGNPDNIGRIFEVLQFAGEYEVDGLVGPGWWTKPVGGVAISVAGVMADQGLLFDAWLRPISGIPDQEETTKQEPVAA